MGRAEIIERLKTTRQPGGLHWYPVRVWWPVRLTHDRDGFLLRSAETGNRRSRWFQVVLRCDECSWPFQPAFRSLPDTEER